MSFLRNMVLSLLASGGLVIGGGLLLPRHLTVEKTIDVARAPATVYTLTNNLRRFNEFSPWYDPSGQTLYTVSGPDVGVGQTLSWRSTDPSIGKGEQTIILSDQFSRIEQTVEFGAGSEANVNWSFEPIGKDRTRVVWSLSFDTGYNIIARYVCQFMARESVGADFTHGLKRLKALVETLPSEDFASSTPTLAEMPDHRLLARSGEAASAAALPTLVEIALDDVNSLLSKNGVQPQGPPMIQVIRLDNGALNFAVGYSLAPNAVPPTLAAMPSLEWIDVAGGDATRLALAGDGASFEEGMRAMGAYAAVAALPAPDRYLMVLRTNATASDPALAELWSPRG